MKGSLMNQDFADIPNCAAEIVRSGKWEAIGDSLRKHCLAGEEWWRQLLTSLYAQGSSEYRGLTSAYANVGSKDPPLLAWRARNLLELCVWSRYCQSDRKAARRLYEDGGRDVRDLYEKVLSFGKAGNFTGTTPPNWSDPFDKALQDLNGRAKAEGIDSLDGAPTLVSNAAGKCGIGEKYVLINKMLSKFVHPSALRMMGNSDAEHEKLQAASFFNWGCLFFVGIYVSLDAQTRAQVA